MLAIKMSRKLMHVLLAFVALISTVQAGAADEPTARDTKGFLPVPPAASPSSPATAPSPTMPVVASATNAPMTESTNVLSDYVLDEKHKLMPGDVVSFQIKEDRTNALQRVVAESAELDIPYIGRVSVKGRTCKQLADEIKASLEKDYYYRATVIIGLDALSRVAGKVYVFGPVRNPGPQEIPANENYTAGKAIMKAGGFGDFANPKKVQIIRKTETGNKTFIVNLVNVLKKGMTQEDITLEPDDFIIVPESGINFGW